jgi:hypothetical protein
VDVSKIIAGLPHIAKGERLVNEIAVITQTSPEEVLEFYLSCGLSLEDIKQIALQGAELNKDSIEKTMAEGIAEGILPTKSLTDIAKELNEMFPKTWKDYLSDIPFYFAYYLGYPFIWLAYWLWQGIMQAKDEVWD